MSIVVIDYGMGNLRSVSKALEHVAGGKEVIVTADPAVVAVACVPLCWPPPQRSRFSASASAYKCSLNTAKRAMLPAWAYLPAMCGVFPKPKCLLPMVNA